MESRSVEIDGRTYLLRIEPSYWEALDEICERERMTLGELCSDLWSRLGESLKRTGRRTDNDRLSLANAVRVFAVGYYRQAATERGHDLAGHGHGNPFVATPFETGEEPVSH